jgi:hypothetical protein
MKAHAKGAGLAILLSLCGCADADYTESDSGKTIEVDQGAGFTVALPRMPTPRPAPDIKGALVRPLQRRVDTSTNQEIFPFVCEGVGDAIIRIPSTDPSAAEFVIQVHVLPIHKPGAAGTSGPGNAAPHY